MLKENSGKVTLFTGQSLSEIRARRQELPDVYIRNDFIYLFRSKNLYVDKPGLYGDNVKLMKIDENRNDIDINTEKDWKIAEYIFKDEI
jgi:CMP-N-acetylneuraminic acid synthetase